MKRIFVIVAVMFATGASLAGDMKVVMRPVTSFGYLDTDKDSRITPKEAEADWAVVKSFEQADTNHDGYLSKEEFDTLSKG